jgi:hypothetical protein
MQPEPQDGQAEEIRVGPVECPSREEAERGGVPQEKGKLPLTDADRERIAAARKRPRFSIGELLAITTFVAVGLAGVRWLPPGAFAGLCSLAAIVALVLLMVLRDATRGFRLFLWGLLLVYVVAVFASLLTQTL